jgi:4-hydroxy-2-oxoheptanedioate aldolase
VHVPTIDKAPVKLALDLRAEGIAFTLVGNVEEAADWVAHTRYPPHGRRNWGLLVAHARCGVHLSTTCRNAAPSSDQRHDGNKGGPMS